MENQKNLRKVLALALAFATTGTIVTSASAAQFSDVKITDASTPAINMLADLTVINGYKDGSYRPEETVTRAEACQIIANLMNGGLADVSQFAGGANFSDVPKGDWQDAPISYCVQNGIAIGVGNGKFEPNRGITDAEFITMMNRALGYETATHKLEYPLGHLTAAQAKGLLNKTTVVPNSECQRKEVAQITYNGLFADFARASAQDNIIHGSSVLNKTTIIENRFNLVRAFVEDKKSDVIGSNKNSSWSHHWVLMRDDCDSQDGYVAKAVSDGGTETGKAIKFKSTIDLSQMIGHKVELYVDKDASKSNPRIKAVKLVDNQSVYEYDPSMKDDKDDNKLTVSDHTLILKKDIDSTTEKSLNSLNGNKYKLFDWNSDDIIDFVSKDAVKYYYVDSVDKDGTNIRLLSTDGKNDVSSKMSTRSLKCPNGESVDEIVINGYDGIKSGHVVEATETFVTEGSKHIVKYNLTQVEPVKEKLTKTSTKGSVKFDDKEVMIADDSFKDSVISNNPSNLDFSRNGKIGDTYSLYYNRNGMIIASDIGSASNTAKYLMVTGYGEYSSGSSGSRNKNAEIDVVYSNGKQNREPLKIDKNAVIKLDGDKKNVWDGYTFSGKNGSDIVGKVFSYEADGEYVTELIEVADLESSREPFSFDDRSLELFDDNDRRVADMSRIDDVFVVTDGWDSKLTSNNNSYINPNYVEVVSPKDLPNIVASSSSSSRSTKGKDYAIGSGKNDDVALLYVDKLSYRKNNSTKVGLVTALDTESSDKKTNITLYGDGGEIGVLKNVSNNDIIGTDNKDNSNITVSDLRRIISDKQDGAYIEYDINPDGNIESITLMSKVDDHMEGKYFSVVRGVVSNTRGDDVTLERAYGYDKDSLWAVDNEDKEDFGTYRSNKDSKYYEINVAPEIDTSSDKHKIQVAKPSNISSSDYSVSSHNGNTAIASNFGKSNTHTDDEYFVADIVVDKSKSRDIIALYQYTKSVDAGDVYVEPDMQADFVEDTLKNDGSGSLVGTFKFTSTTMGSYKVVSKSEDAEDASTHFNFNWNPSESKLTVTPKGTVTPGEYTLVVTSNENPSIKVEHDFTVVDADTYTVVKPSKEPETTDRTFVFDIGMTEEELSSKGITGANLSVKAMKYVSDGVGGVKNYEEDESVTFELAGDTYSIGTPNKQFTFNITSGDLKPYHAIKVVGTGAAEEIIGDNSIIPLKDMVMYKKIADVVAGLSVPNVVISKSSDEAVTVTTEFDSTIGEMEKNNIKAFITAIGTASTDEMKAIQFNGQTYNWDAEESKYKETANDLVEKIYETIQGQSTSQSKELTIGTVTITLNVNKKLYSNPVVAEGTFAPKATEIKFTINMPKDTMDSSSIDQNDFTVEGYRLKDDTVGAKQYEADAQLQLQFKDIQDSGGKGVVTYTVNGGAIKPWTAIKITPTNEAVAVSGAEPYYLEVHSIEKYEASKDIINTVKDFDSAKGVYSFKKTITVDPSEVRPNKVKLKTTYDSTIGANTKEDLDNLLKCFHDVKGSPIDKITFDGGSPKEYTWGSGGSSVSKYVDGSDYLIEDINTKITGQSGTQTVVLTIGEVEVTIELTQG